jgi:protein-S-isoprenylcysteine O-methyltransferase Ste14
MATLKRSIVASVLFTLFGGPGILLVLVPWWMTGFHVVRGWNEVVGWALIVLGLAPLLESTVRFILVGRGALIPTVPTERLVVSGLYRFVRNPMYLGVMMVLGGEALLFWSERLAVELALVAVAVNLFVRFYEEPKLTETFGEEYRNYQRHVGRWIPRLMPWKG